MIGFIRDWLRARSGAIAMNFALMVIPLIACVGLAVDGSRMYLVKYNFQGALDSAALAVGTTYGSQQELNDLAQLYVSRNFDMPGVTVESVSVTSSAEKVFLTGTVKMNTFFIQIVAGDQVMVSAETDVKRAGGGIMVSLVLDNTGSMWGSMGGGKNRIEALRSASLSLTKSLFDSEDAEDEVRMAVVPYASMVNPGDAAPGIINPLDLAAFKLQDPQNRTGVAEPLLQTFHYDPKDKTQWKGCVLERGGDDSIADTPPSFGKKWTPMLWPIYNDNQYEVHDNGFVIGTIKPGSVDPGGNRNSNSFSGPNVGCPTPILPLTGKKKDVEDALKDMTAWNRGGTLSDIGMAWGIRTLSPGVPFDESSKIVDKKTGEVIWNSPRWRRAIVLMTDGDNSIYNAGNDGSRVKKGSEKSDITGYGRLGETQMNDLFNTTNSSNVAKKIDNRVTQLCNEAKAMNIIVYTVVLSNSADSGTRAIFQNCATDKGKYWYAPSSDALDDAFGSIGSDLNKLRITR
ncbi:TadE/TadG family type IV pilus assembly protein [Henriciella sp. AS95]|uniref:TadE/TadG family type IV pilus assembly protein n=1 Tax=Henriciella sp. AS95 TaxID=3135782 RepID=UPI0031778826